MDWTSALFQLIGKVVATGGSAAVVAYAVFVFLSKKWLEAKFSERLEAFKHEQNKEIEQLKYRINAQFNRISKIHEKEIEVLPEAWTRMMTAASDVAFLASPMREYQDLDRLSGAQLESFLSGSSLLDWEKDELRASTTKLKYFQERSFYHELWNAKKSFHAFHAYIHINSIFLSKDIKTKFLAIDDALSKTIIETEIDHDARLMGMPRTISLTINTDVEALKHDLEALVQKRLQLDQAD